MYHINLTKTPFELGNGCNIRNARFYQNVKTIKVVLSFQKKKKKKNL